MHLLSFVTEGEVKTEKQTKKHHLTKAFTTDAREKCPCIFCLIMAARIEWRKCKNMERGREITFAV